MRDLARFGGLHLGGLDHRLDLLRVDARGEILVRAQRGVLARLAERRPTPRGLVKETHRPLGVIRQNRLQVDGEEAEGVERGGERRARRLRVRLDCFPRLLAVEILVRQIGDAADFDDGLVEATRLVEFGDPLRGGAGGVKELASFVVERPQAAVELLLQHLRGA